MRATFFKTIETFYKKDKSMYVLTADLGYKLFDPFQTACADRFYDIGVAEANMIGVASGLALSGKNVYCYSIIPFLVMRAFEQIRVDIAYHNLSVKLIGVGGGFTYGLEGFTHFGLEDLALMRALPNMTVCVPADPLEAEALAKISCTYEGPLYIRLGKTGEPNIHEKAPDFQIGKALFLKEGKDVALFAIGSMVHTVKQVVETLKKQGIDATLINMHTLKPLDTAAIQQVISTHLAIFSIEEHYTEGGLGSALAEVIAESRYRGRFCRIGIDSLNDQHVGHAEHLKDKYGLTVEKISGTIIRKLEVE